MIAGVDEAGRGAWVGNVVAAAVILPPDYDLPYLSDSKKLSPKRREQLFAAIDEQALAWGYGEVSAATIDAINIHQAALLAMRLALDALALHPSLALIDGKFVPPDLPYPARAIIDGDALEPAIAAASIMAKVLRDRQMIELDKQYPQYGFAAHKGYGTAQHSRALREHGIIAEHRRSYAPIKALLKLG